MKCQPSIPYEPCEHCVGPFPLVGLMLTWFIWGRRLALHIALYKQNLSLGFPKGVNVTMTAHYLDCVFKMQTMHFTLGNT